MDRRVAGRTFRWVGGRAKGEGRRGRALRFADNAARVDNLGVICATIVLAFPFRLAIIRIADSGERGRKPGRSRRNNSTRSETGEFHKHAPTEDGN